MNPVDTMNAVTTTALLGFLVVAPGLFAMLSPRRAVIGGFILGWLFLPQTALQVQGLPDISKSYVVSFGVLLGVMLFNPGRLLLIRPRWFDVPMGVWCIVPLASSMSNGLGLYDGLSAVLNHVLLWGVPYYLGRIYFTDLEALRELAVAVVIGGLVYVPLCLWEVRMAPTLHYNLYGFNQHVFAQHIRGGGGYRPMVFMQHGLMVAMWMTWATLAAWWLWGSGSLRRLWGMPMGPLVALLLVTTVLCKSIGALALLVVGFGAYCSVRWMGWRGPIWGIVLIVPLYLGVRATGMWSGEEAVSVARMLVGEERANSLAGRIYNETLLVDKALERPLLGYGGWSAWRVRDERSRDNSTSDGLWVIALGQNGLVGLVSVTLATLLPLALMLRRCPSREWLDPRVAPAAALALVMGLWAIDNLPNAMVNPVYLLAAGGVMGLFASSSVRRAHTVVPDRSRADPVRSGVRRPPARPTVPRPGYPR